MSNEDRVTTFCIKKNRFENIHISFEVAYSTPVVSVRSFRGDKFTGKGLSLQPELWEILVIEIMKAVHGLRCKLADDGVADAPAKTITKISKNSRKKVGSSDVGAGGDTA